MERRRILVIHRNDYNRMHRSLLSAKRAAKTKDKRHKPTTLVCDPLGVRPNLGVPGKNAEFIYVSENEVLKTEGLQLYLARLANHNILAGRAENLR